MTRDVAPRLGFRKPSTLYCKFFPPLQGRGGKMSGSEMNGAVYITDTANVIKKRINKHAFSGGQETLELQVCIWVCIWVCVYGCVYVYMGVCVYGYIYVCCVCISIHLHN
mgnify:CR=1 FL=1